MITSQNVSSEAQVMIFLFCRKFFGQLIDISQGVQQFSGNLSNNLEDGS